MPSLGDSELKEVASRLQQRIEELERENITLRTQATEQKLQVTIANSKHKARECELLMRIKSLQRLLGDKERQNKQLQECNEQDHGEYQLYSNHCQPKARSSSGNHFEAVMHKGDKHDFQPSRAPQHAQNTYSQSSIFSHSDQFMTSTPKPCPGASASLAFFSPATLVPAQPIHMTAFPNHPTPLEKTKPKKRKQKKNLMHRLRRWACMGNEVDASFSPTRRASLTQAK